MTKRIDFIDALKGFAIFCVLWIHSLQYLHGAYNSLHNPMVEFIFSFNMPLFFMISGFFFSSSLKQDLKDFLLKKGKQLLLPCFTWAIIFTLSFAAAKIYRGEQLNYLVLIKKLKPPFWFLKELFISYVLVYFSMKILRKQWLACVLSILFVMFAPFCDRQRFLLPIFWVGTYLKDNYQYVVKYSKPILLISAILFAICLIFWNGDYTIYVLPFKLFSFKQLSFNFKNFDISLFRLMIGIVGSLFWFILFQEIYRNNKFFSVLKVAGTYTMGIYILQKTILEKWINKLLDFPNVNIFVYNFLITPLIAISVCIVCIFLIKFISKNRTANILLLGQKY